MDIFKDEISQEINKVSKKIESSKDLDIEDLKMILLSLLNEEDSHERKQQP
jgi:hypothetical protein